MSDVMIWEVADLFGDILHTLYTMSKIDVKRGLSGIGPVFSALGSVSWCWTMSWHHFSEVQHDQQRLKNIFSQNIFSQSCDFWENWKPAPINPHACKTSTLADGTSARCMRHSSTLSWSSMNMLSRNIPPAFRGMSANFSREKTTHTAVKSNADGREGMREASVSTAFDQASFQKYL